MQFGTRYAICNVLHGAQIFSEDMSRSVVPRHQRLARRGVAGAGASLRASIVVPMHSPELSVAEIERRAADPRFVQVLVLEMGELPLGARHWPIYARPSATTCRSASTPAAATAIRRQSSAGRPTTWKTMSAGRPASPALLISLISEGVFVEFPRLKVVLMESGVTWLPGWMWRADKTWRGVRAEVPWLKEPPATIMRRACAPDHAAVRRAARGRPVEAHHRGDRLRRDAAVLDRLSALAVRRRGALPDGLPAALARKILVDNALKTYSRLSAMAGSKEAAS